MSKSDGGSEPRETSHRGHGFQGTFGNIILAVFAVIAAMWIMTAVGCGMTAANDATYGADVERIHVYTLDVGQGDAHVIRTKDGITMIDTGDVAHRPRTVQMLKDLGVEKIDRLIVTHPHSDHLGGFRAIVDEIPIGVVYENGYSHGSSVYRTYVKTVKRLDIPVKVARSGDVIDLGGGATFEVYAPWSDPILDGKGRPDPNNNSIVGKLVYGKFSMLFTGDAEAEEENRLVKEKNSKLFSRVLKVPHHGSNGSSGIKFLKSVKAEIAVIPVGLANDYGHPGNASMQRLESVGTSIYRTDLQGTIHIVTDGKTWSIETER